MLPLPILTKPYLYIFSFLFSLSFVFFFSFFLFSFFSGGVGGLGRPSPLAALLILIELGTIYSFNFITRMF